MRLQEMNSFFDYVRSVGVVSANAVHNWSGAVSAIAQCLEEEEQTVEFLRGQPDIIRERLFGTKRDISRHTIEAYLQRAQSAASHFVYWKEDPAGWERDVATKPRRGRRRQGIPGPRPKEHSAPPDARPAVPSPMRELKNSIQIPTATGSAIKLEFPDSFVMNDVLRVMWALAVHAKDFDPEQVLKSIGKPPVQDTTPKNLLSLSGGTH